MEFENLSYIHVLTSPQEFSWENPGNNKVLPSFIFEFINPEVRDKDFHDIFYAELNGNFSLTLSADDFSASNHGDWIDKFLLILCHPNYYKIAKYHIVGYIAPSQHEDSVRMFLDWLTQKSANQGFNILFVDVNSDGMDVNEMFSHVNYINTDKNIEFEQWYLQTLLNRLSILNIFSNAAALPNLLSARRQAETNLQAESPTIYKLLEHLHTEKIEGIRYRQNNETLREELASKNEYLDFILGKFKKGQGVEGVEFNQAMQIKQFYYNEYELLPLWYKRFGHILKVILGKRTFKSLFDDNVEKYKK